jgi:hypothetical protein
VSRALAERHARERAEERTAESLGEWTQGLATQVGAAWILSCVFVRTLEDRGLLRQARLAGPGALDSQRLFFQLAPSLTERDYLLMVFREIARHPAARDLFDGEHSLVWKLSPSAGAAKELLALFRTPNAEAPAFRFGQASTRFLGDLYQDLSEEVRKRYALLQTPHFIESFILDRTLEPAIARFGLDETTVIDPTCGSGHFLLGAFDRLFEHRLRSEPGIDARVAATKALDAVYGADINPYAVAIARFRLTLSFLEKTGYGKLADAPALPLHLVVADSLLHNPQQRQTELGHVAGQSAARWGGEVFALEDEAAARNVLHRQYAAVVGNPPYITEKDPVRREVYRRMYEAAAGKYALSAPFCERFFQLARARGYVGQITANSFMKREFGKKLIEEVLPAVNLDLIVNTSGAYIPGHGTPTVLLFGTQEAPQGTDVLAVLAKRGEPLTPDDPAKGEVWSSIEGHFAEVGFENEYVSVARVERDMLRKHPWSLGGGGANELKELLEERTSNRLGDVCVIGVFGMTNADDCMLMTRDQWTRTPVESEFIRALVIGEDIRDWAWSSDLCALYPYRWPHALLREGEAPGLFKYLWPYRAVLWERATFGGGTYRSDGLPWWKWHQVTESRVKGPSIAFAEVATHNHFVLDRGGKVFKQTAPIIKLPDGATEDDHLALLAYLNSSTACFWMKQVAMNKAGSGIGRGIQDEAWESRFAFDGTKLSALPLPRSWQGLARLGRDADNLAQALASRYSDDRFAQLVALQERIDWEVYRLFNLIDSVPPIPQSIDPGSRAFEHLLVRDQPTTAWFERNQYARPSGEPPHALIAAIEGNPHLRLIEQPEYKHRWTIRDVSAENAAHERSEALAELETSARRHPEPRPLPSLAESEAVPFLAAYRFTDDGLAKHALWLATWDAQRAEDAGEKVTIDVPPRYSSDDFASHTIWQLRGKLDVPRERFISYPGCESDEDHQPVYGWAGWDHLQRAQALAALHLKRKDGEGWQKERLTPMLAGLLELIPWVKQWHNEPSDEFGGLRMGDYFQQFLDGECRQLGLTHDDLRAWRPPRKTRAARTTKARPAPAPLADGSTAPALSPAQKAAATRARRKAAASSADGAAAGKSEIP